MTNAPIRHRENSGVVDSAQGLQTPWRFMVSGNPCLRTLAFFKKGLQRNSGVNPGMSQATSRFQSAEVSLECRKQSSQGTAVRCNVGQNSQAEPLIAFGAPTSVTFPQASRTAWAML